MNRPSGDDPWSGFWAQQGSARTRGCIPNASSSIDQVQERWWREFAAKLPRKARVLDLGTGSGFVLAKLHAARLDLRLVGVDSASILPPARKPIQLRPQVSIEHLPFGKTSFDAVVSQFGYEYSDTQRSALEVARVLAPDGRVSMIVHHRRGPVVVHNLARRDGIRWILEEQQLVERAIRFASTPQLLNLPVPARFVQVVAEAKALPASQSVAVEIAQAVLQTLSHGRDRAPTAVVDRLRDIQAKALGESARISALEKAARAGEEIEALAGELQSAGVAMEPPVTLSESDVALPFAWLINGRR